MSWDVYILKFDGQLSLEKMDANGFKPLPMGVAQEVRERISVQWPETDWSDPEWGYYEAGGCSIEFNLGSGTIEGLMLHIRGGGNPVPSIVNFCRENDWTAIDGDSFLDEASVQSWQEWQKFRDQVTHHLKETSHDDDH